MLLPPNFVKASVLLLIDDPIDGLKLKSKLEAYQPCVVLPVQNTPRKAATHWLICCKVRNFEPNTKESLRVALKHYRFDPAVPLVFILDEPTADLENQAHALGATAIIERNAPIEDFLSTFKSCRQVYIDSRYSGLSTSNGRSSASIEIIGGTINNLFESAALKKEISLHRLEEGAETLVDSVKRIDLKKWINIVRSYDNATYQHCLLVSGLVATFSMHLGLSLSTQHWLAQAAMIHDIGKSQIPLRILNKSGSLTSEEVEMMKLHTIYGHDILSRQGNFDKKILHVVRHHHEMIDGSGYPDQLRGNDIHESVRITTICNIYADLVERKPHKPSMTSPQARAALRDMGRKLDARLLDAFDETVQGC